MPDYHVPRGSNAQASTESKGSSRSGPGQESRQSAEISSKSLKGAYFDGAAEVNCDFECDSLRVGSGGILHINGNLTVTQTARREPLDRSERRHQGRANRRGGENPSEGFELREDEGGRTGGGRRAA